MANLYLWGINPFQDILLESIMQSIDISNKDIKNDIDIKFMSILKYVVKNENDIVYLNFDVINNNEYFKVRGNNIISALWLSGIIPDNIETIMTNNRFKIKNREYHYSEKTNELTYKNHYE